MSDSVLDRVDRAVTDFVPRSQREFVALQIARRFQDTHRLARYVLVARDHPKKIMLEAARVAWMRHELNRAPAGDLFFEVLAEFDGGGQT
jgi:hypothetical protein